MKRIILISFILVLSQFAFGQKINFIRVCNGGNNNQLFWQINADTCLLMNTIKINGRDASSFPFYGIDSGIVTTNKNYIHLNSNVPSVKDWEYFIEYKIKCGKDTITRFSDTLKIDDQKPDSTILDSVSVDPILNVVYLGWASNKTPDFSSYYLYNYDRADPRLIENYRDTFYTDLTPINPKTKSLSYDITSSDSCDNRKDYGNYKHQTIYLTGTNDTCINSVNIKWSDYIGWGVRSYYIYRKESLGIYSLIDSVGGSTLQYQDKNLLSKTSYEYFVRAFKNGSKIVSSSSNGSERFIMGTSTNPINTEIVQITNNDNDKLELQIKRNAVSNYSTIDLFRSNSISSPVFVHTFSGVEDLYEDASVSNINTHNYYLLSKNMCGIVTDTSKISNNVVLRLSENTDDLLLNWQRYSTWNNGVKNYTIYRSSGNTVSEASNFMAITSTAIDTLFTDPKQTLAVACYYIVANESSGIGSSKSNTVCYIKTGRIYFPNAISINGNNKIFTFIGEGIDLLQSSIQIYNRWGGLEYNKDDISSGWDGRNNMGEILSGDVYFFTAQISQGKDKINLSGNITILR